MGKLGHGEKTFEFVVHCMLLSKRIPSKVICQVSTTSFASSCSFLLKNGGMLRRTFDGSNKSKCSNSNPRSAIELSPLSSLEQMPDLLTNSVWNLTSMDWPNKGLDALWGHPQEVILRCYCFCNLTKLLFVHIDFLACQMIISVASRITCGVGY